MKVICLLVDYGSHHKARSIITVENIVIDLETLYINIFFNVLTVISFMKVLITKWITENR